MSQMGPLINSHHKILTTFLLIPDWFLIVVCPSVSGLCLVGESNRGPFVQESSALSTIPARHPTHTPHSVRIILWEKMQ